MVQTGKKKCNLITFFFVFVFVFNLREFSGNQIIFLLVSPCASQIIMNVSEAELPWRPQTELKSVELQVRELYPFHDGWNVACFVILLLFILTVLSLAALAFLYELLDCGCFAKGKTVREQREEPGTFCRVMERVGGSSHTEVV